MTKKTLIAALLVTLVFVFVAYHASRTSQAATKISWEYKLVAEPGAKSLFVAERLQDNERFLNSLGADGWELVALEPGFYILKRQR